MSSQLDLALILLPLKGAKNEIDRCSHSNSSDGKQQHIRVFENGRIESETPSNSRARLTEQMRLSVLQKITKKDTTLETEKMLC